jgi:ribosomal protein S25
MFDAVAKAISTSAEQAAAEKAAAEAALQSKKSKKVVINTGTQTNIGATTVDPEMNMEVVKSIQPRPVVVATDAAEKSTQAVAAVPTTNTSDLKEIAPESVGKDAIKFGEGKLVIVIGEGDVFNMSIITANAGGSIGSVNKAEVYNVKYYPDGTTTPSLVLECKKVQGPAAFDGQPRTYIGEITKAWTK